MNDGEISRFAIRAEDELGVGIEAGGVRVVPDVRGRNHFARVRIHYHHFLIAADGE